jgi:hypothetical protein
MEGLKRTPNYLNCTVTNHPMTTECIDTIHYGTARTKTAIFEVKGIMKCPTRYATDISPTTKRATDLTLTGLDKWRKTMLIE